MLVDVDVDRPGPGTVRLWRLLLKTTCPSTAKMNDPRQIRSHNTINTEAMPCHITTSFQGTIIQSININKHLRLLPGPNHLLEWTSLFEHFPVIHEYQDFISRHSMIGTCRTVILHLHPLPPPPPPPLISNSPGKFSRSLREAASCVDVTIPGDELSIASFVSPSTTPRALESTRRTAAALRLSLDKSDVRWPGY